MGDSHINDYRQPFESDEHWTLRKEFLERFRDDFSEDRLLCLAQVYSNVELLGCSYPAPVMRQIRELSKDLQECLELRDKRKERAAVKFVKEKQKAPPRNSWNNSGAFSQKRSSSETQTNNQTSCGTSAKKFKASDSNTCTASSTEICSNSLSGTESSNFSISKQFSPSENSCQKSPFDNVNIGQNSSKSVIQKSDAVSVETSREETQQMDTLPKSLKDNFTDIFQFIRKSLAKQLTPLAILNNMAQKFCLKVEYNFKFLPGEPALTTECSLEIDNVLISKAKECTKKKARSEVAKLAVDLLMKPLPKAGSSNSGNLNKPCIDSNNEILAKQKHSMRVAELSSDNKNNMGTYGNGSWSNDRFSNTSDNSGNVSMLNSNYHNSLFYKNAHRDQNFHLNPSSCNVPLNKVVAPNVYQNSASVPISWTQNCAKQNARDIKPIKQPNKKKHTNSRCTNSFPEFLVILDNSDVTKSDAASSLFTGSANFNHVPFQYEYETCVGNGQNFIRAQITLNGDPFCSGFGENKQLAKEAVSKAAVDILKKTAYTIKVKDEHDDGFTVSRSQVFDTAESNNSIAESNIGCKMLKMMGWSGGGIGKEGKEGIEEPVKAVEKHKFGQGLGYTKKGNAEVSFTARVEQIIQDYAKSNSTSDLIFSTEFSKEERKEIHRIACKYGLKNNSKGGKGDGRHLIVSRRYTAQQLINRLKQCHGWRTHKYELIAPTG